MILVTKYLIIKEPVKSFNKPILPWVTTVDEPE